MVKTESKQVKNRKIGNFTTPKMLPTAGYFRTIPCPFYTDDKPCKRPYCHFKHIKHEKQKSKELPVYKATPISQCNYQPSNEEFVPSYNPTPIVKTETEENIDFSLIDSMLNPPPDPEPVKEKHHKKSKKSSRESSSSRSRGEKSKSSSSKHHKSDSKDREKDRKRKSDDHHRSQRSSSSSDEKHQSKRFAFNFVQIFQFFSIFDFPPIFNFFLISNFLSQF